MSKKNRNLKRVLRARASHTADRRDGFRVVKEWARGTPCEKCGDPTTTFEYTGTIWSLRVSDCETCLTTQETACGIASGTRVDRTLQHLNFLYGALGEEVRAEADAAVAATRRAS
jgi:hypothetical protein